MSRVDDVIHNYLTSHRITDPIHCGLIDEISKAIRYGFEQGESFGKYGAFIEKQNEKIAEAIIQPENDRAWQKELDDIMKDCRNTTCRSNESKTVRLLGLIAEMILYTRRGG